MCTPARHPLVSLFLLLTGYLLLVCIVFVGDPRYHYALLPLAVILAAKGLLDGLPSMRKVLAGEIPGGRHRLGAWGGAVGAYLAFIVLNLFLKFLEFARYAHNAQAGL